MGELVVISSGEARCSLAGVGREQTAVLEVSLNGVDFVGAGGAFSFSRAVHVLRLSPARGPANGGTHVNVTVHPTPSALHPAPQSLNPTP